MDCIGCIWFATAGEDQICLRRDHLKADEDQLHYPENPGYGCDQKEIIVTNSLGDKIIRKGAEIFEIPWGYS